MDTLTKPAPEAIRRAGVENPKTRARELAAQLGVSEAETVAAWCGEGALRVAPLPAGFLPRMEAVGEVLALTRNESAVHEKVGVYDNFVAGKHASMMLGEAIDTRMFPAHWVHAFAVEKPDGDAVRRSLQIFDAQGDAVHKIHLRPASNVEAWQALVDGIAAPDQSQSIEIAAAPEPDHAVDAAEPVEELRRRWSRMTDTHQFVGIIRKLKLSRRKAVHLVGEDYAWPLAVDAVETMMRQSADAALPIMCFVGNRGCIQIHSGPIAAIKSMGPWLNVMDPTFHLHLRADRIREVWAVRKPTDKGHVTSLEAYDADGSLIIQFFGKRIEGQDERAGWRTIVETLPRTARIQAA